MKSFFRTRFQQNWIRPVPLFSGVVLLLWLQTGYTQSCESTNRVPSTSFFDLVEHQQADFESNGELIHAKILSFTHQDMCKHAFRIKWIADDGALNELYYDAQTFEKIDQTTHAQISHSDLASEPNDPGGGGSGGPGGGGSGGPGGGGSGGPGGGGSGGSGGGGGAGGN